MTYDEARMLSAAERVAGLEVEGTIPPFGGSWRAEGGKLILVETPTGDSLPPPPPPAES